MTISPLPGKVASHLLDSLGNGPLQPTTTMGHLRGGWMSGLEELAGAGQKIDFLRPSARFKVSTDKRQLTGGELDSTGLRKGWLHVVVDQKAT